MQKTGLVAVAPAGRSSTWPTLPSASVVVTICAPPVSVHPSPLNASTDWPGASSYQLLSFANGCVSCGAGHASVGAGYALATAGRMIAAAAAVTAAAAKRERRLKRAWGIGTHLPWCALAAEPSHPTVRPLALRPRLATGLPFSEIGR